MTPISVPIHYSWVSPYYDDNGTAISTEDEKRHGEEFLRAREAGGTGTKQPEPGTEPQLPIRTDYPLWGGGSRYQVKAHVTILRATEPQQLDSNVVDFRISGPGQGDEGAFNAILELGLFSGTLTRSEWLDRSDEFSARFSQSIYIPYVMLESAQGHCYRKSEDEIAAGLTRILDNYPTFARRDEVLLLLGRCTKDPQRSRAYLEQLAAQYPEREPDALFELGEYDQLMTRYPKSRLAREAKERTRGR